LPTQKDAIHTATQGGCLTNGQQTDQEPGENRNTQGKAAVPGKG
jgi:hypothetical protein